MAAIVVVGAAAPAFARARSFGCRLYFGPANLLQIWRHSP
jgi:hypothetical protein